MVTHENHDQSSRGITNLQFYKTGRETQLPPAHTTPAPLSHQHRRRHQAHCRRLLGAKFAQDMHRFRWLCPPRHTRISDPRLPRPAPMPSCMQVSAGRSACPSNLTPTLSRPNSPAAVARPWWMGLADHRRFRSADAQIKQSKVGGGVAQQGTTVVADCCRYGARTGVGLSLRPVAACGAPCDARRQRGVRVHMGTPACAAVLSGPW